MSPNLALHLLSILHPTCFSFLKCFSVCHYSAIPPFPSLSNIFLCVGLAQLETTTRIMTFQPKTFANGLTLFPATKTRIDLHKLKSNNTYPIHYLYKTKTRLLHSTTHYYSPTYCFRDVRVCSILLWFLSQLLVG